MAIIKKFRIKNFKQKKELIKLDKVSIYFGKRKIFEDLNFSLNQGEILGLLGPNGVGKSTIFNIIIGLLKPNYGSIFIEQENITNEPIFHRTKKYKIGYVPQHGGYFYDLTLRENLKAISEMVIADSKLRDERKIEVSSSDGIDVLAYARPVFDVGFSDGGRSSNPGAGRLTNRDREDRPQTTGTKKGSYYSL